MKKKRRSQISMEYILIITLALMILVPAMYLFRSYTFESNDRIIESRISQIVKEIIDTGRDMYYYGSPSKTILIEDMPPQIQSVAVLKVSAAGKTEYQLLFNILTNSGENPLYYESDFPIYVEDPILAADCIAILNKEHKDICAAAGHECSCFPERFYSKGQKNIQVKASTSCNGESSCVLIKEASGDI